eukprot:m.123318 g.123318  ORF g.123318 m.123318 type:complete len:291 (+) comp23384_c0_seq6:207-1079(+)
MLRHQCMYTPHLECPDRILGIMKELKTQGLAEQCVEVEPRDCTRDELLLVHTINHCDQGEKIADMNQDQLNKLAENFNSIYLNPGSVESADRAAGSLLAVTEKVVKGELENGVAVIRPPGHHAEADFPMGFCIHNSVAVAAAKARKDWGVNRVLIVDWDVHHGNGTQHMFEDDPSVLYFSTHRYDNGFFYPNSNDADPTTVGKGAGAGFSVNVGWNQRAMGDVELVFASSEEEREKNQQASRDMEDLKKKVKTVTYVPYKLLQIPYGVDSRAYAHCLGISARACAHFSRL